MLVRVERLTASACGAVLVEVHTSVGMVTARWRGDTEATRGEHHVEWTLDEEFRWGQNCFQAAAKEPRLRDGDRVVVVRGQLRLDVAEDIVGDHAVSGKHWANLALGNALIVLGHIEAPLTAWPTHGSRSTSRPRTSRSTRTRSDRQIVTLPGRPSSAPPPQSRNATGARPRCCSSMSPPERVLLNQ